MYIDSQEKYYHNKEENNTMIYLVIQNDGRQSNYSRKIL